MESLTAEKVEQKVDGKEGKRKRERERKRRHNFLKGLFVCFRI
jgi:hypothetical protein